ncbi:MAG: HDIG domain-containing protein [Bacteroidales bacterium]|nr:HDIG domain-containing protein [Bacteroidales bacterium]
MERSRNNLSLINTWSGIFRILIYVAAVVVILFALPKEGKFKYEYQKGSPWKHENLIAPFDFAIYKSAAEIEDDKNTLIQDTKHYFNKDNHVLVANIEHFLRSYNALMKEHLGRTDTINDTLISSSDLYHNFRNTIYNALSFVYQNGILESESLPNGTSIKDRVILIKDGTMTTQKPSSEVFTTKTAYLYIKNCMRAFMSESAGKMSSEEFKNLEKIVEGLNPNQWLEQNINYDDATTQKVLNENINNISLTRGIVQQGQRIIFQGEMVNEEEFRILESLRREYEQSDHGAGYNYTFLGQAIVFVLFFTLIYLFLRTFRREIFYQTKYSLLILCLMTAVIVGMSLVIRYNPFSIWVVPFLLLALIIKTFFDTRTALFFHIMTCVATGFVVPNSFEYFVMQFVPGYFMIISLEQINRRGLVFRTSFICFVLYALVYLSFEFMYNGNINETNWTTLIDLGINSMLLLLAYPVIYLFEKVFGLLSDVTLVELADSNRPLLRRLAEEAPGTFQHCMQVANLAEAAIFKIGGNPHLARTGALYHDIGKLTAPMYFTENQVTGINPHDKLDNLKSAEIIINHVIKGVDIAKSNKLPIQIIDFIKTHHGTTKAGYFYKMYKNEHPDEDCDAKFTYPGPRPLNKENAVVMMADSIEAASRSLKKYDTSTIGNLVENIVNNQIAQKQFDNTNLTFRDIDTVKELFKEKLMNIYHARIEYPK